MTVVDASGAGTPSRIFLRITFDVVANGALLRMITTSHQTFGMSGHGLPPAELDRVLPKRRTLSLAILATIG